MNFKDFYKTAEKNKYYILSHKDVLSFFPHEKRSNLKQLIHRWKEKKWIYSLKKGLYELTYPSDIAIPDMYIANKLYSPSYVSLETALSDYSIIPEVAMSVTSITTKPTRRFKNKHGLFIYRAVRPEAFTGYLVRRHGTFDILIAEPEKALVDYLYFKAYRNKNYDFSEARLDKDAVSRLNKKKLKKYAELYKMDRRVIHAYL